MKKNTLLQLTKSHGVIKSSVRRLHTTNDKDDGILPASETNRTLYLGTTPDGGTLLWLESEAGGLEVATDEPGQFAEFLSELTDNDIFRLSRYTRLLMGRALFDKILKGIEGDISIQAMEILRAMAAVAVASALTREVAFAEVTLSLRPDWQAFYLPEDADEATARQAVAKLKVILERHGLLTIAVKEGNIPGGDLVEIADEIGDYPPIELRDRILELVREAFEDWQAWVKNLASNPKCEK